MPSKAGNLPLLRSFHQVTLINSSIEVFESDVELKMMRMKNLEKKDVRTHLVRYCGFSGRSESIAMGLKTFGGVDFICLST